MSAVATLSVMSGRTILLFDPNTRPQSWNERMLPGEYAVLYSFSLAAPAILLKS